MAKKIQIICTNPGMRRLGVAHAATQTYDDGHWTEEQLGIFRADPSFHVNEVAEGGAITRGPEFDQAVADEVRHQLSAKHTAMQASFAAAVNDAAAEKVKLAVDEVNSMTAGKIEAAVKVAIDEVNMQLADKIKALETENAQLKTKPGVKR